MYMTVRTTTINTNGKDKLVFCFYRVSTILSDTRKKKSAAEGENVKF